jgi:hypothetical protein
MISFVKDKTDAKAARGKYYLLFIDFKAAYDSVLHARLFEKLRDIGMTGRTIRIIKTIYNNFNLDVNGETVAVNKGVLQGSLISPFLFNIYLNDLIINLSRAVSINNIFGYADDLLVAALGRSALVECLEIIQEWSNRNGI